MSYNPFNNLTSKKLKNIFSKAVLPTAVATGLAVAGYLGYSPLQTAFLELGTSAADPSSLFGISAFFANLGVMAGLATYGVGRGLTTGFSDNSFYMTKANNDGDSDKYSKFFNRAVLPISIGTGLAVAGYLFHGEIVSQSDTYNNLANFYFGNIPTGNIVAAGGFCSAIGGVAGLLTSLPVNKLAKVFSGYTNTTIDTNSASRRKLKKFFGTNNMNKIDDMISDEAEARRYSSERGYDLAVGISLGANAIN